MPRLARAELMWENNPSTPVTANNLSESINFQAQGKFIHFTNNNDDYEQWADHTIQMSEWPPDIELWDPNDQYLNKIIYNFADNSVRKPIFNSDTQRKQWELLPTPFQKILKISAKTRVSAYYTDAESGDPVTINFDFGEQDQIFTIDDLLTESSVLDYEPETRYSIYLYVKHSYNDTAYIKVLKESDESSSFWKSGTPSSSSPTGNDVVSYRKIGGFSTDVGAYVVPDSIWDLNTYHDEITTKKINILDSSGNLRNIAASDFSVFDTQNLFGAGQASLTVEDAIFQTRTLLNNLNNRFYTNRRFGVNLQFSHLVPSGTTYTQAGLDAITLRITPGFLDVLGTQITINEPIYFADPSVGFKINQGTDIITNAKLMSADDGSGAVLYPGVWRIYIDYAGGFTFRHELSENANPRWIPDYFGWFDLTGKRCVAKFRVRNDSGNYIEKFSAVDTFDTNAAVNSIHVQYSTLVPDGLLPCDGKWRDIYGIDTDAYELDELPPVSAWGESWYEETPNYVHTAIRGADPSFQNITAGPYNPLTNEGGADDHTMLGGTENHQHAFPHSHGAGSLGIASSGTHPGGHSVDFNGTTEYVEVDTQAGGQKVSKYDHEHNMTIVGGDHAHQSEYFTGSTEELSGTDANTNTTSSWPPYREALICIKKV